jgi:hypothetical protein
VLYRLAPLAVLALLVIPAFAGTASSASHATRAQAMAAGYDCSPEILILGYYHCAAPGQPSLLDLINGVASPPSLHLNVYYAGTPGDPTTQFLAGTEELIRADLYRGQPCPREGGTWSLLPFGYYGCHHFAP